MREEFQTNGSGPLRRRPSPEWPAEKVELLNQALGAVQSAYNLFQVSLMEALASRSSGELVHARLQARIAAETSDRLASQLLGQLNAISAATNGAGFLWPSFKSSLFRFQIFNLKTDIKATANSMFATAMEIAEGTSVRPGQCWYQLEASVAAVDSNLVQFHARLIDFLNESTPDRIAAFRDSLHSFVPPRLRPPVASLSRVWA